MNQSTKQRAVVATALLATTAMMLTASPTLAATKKTTKPKTTKAPVTTAPAGTAAPTTKAGAASSGFGKVSDTVYKGKGNFQIDLSKCPKDWNINQGITDKEVKIFESLPKSGPLAGFGLIADGMNSYFKYINDTQGGAAGRKLVLETKDDGYEAARTKANVTEAISSGKYSALVTVVGTPNNLAIWDDTTKECMPQLLNGTGAAQWGDVENHPWTTGMQLDYTTEAVLWTEFIKKSFPNGAKIAMLTYNNDFGLSYSKGVRAAVKGTNNTIVKEELHEATAPNLTNQFTNILDTLPDVVLLQTTAVFCTQAMAELEKRGYKGMVIMSGTCGSLSQFFQPLIDQGLTGKDTYILQYLKDVNDKEFANDDFVKLFHATAKAQGLDDKQSTYATGWIFGWYMVEIINLAATYDGGLNRANMLLASRAIDQQMPLVLTGVTNKMDGLNDAYLNESARVARYKVTDPKQLGTFFPQGAVINKEGSLGTYTKFIKG